MNLDNNKDPFHINDNIYNDHIVRKTYDSSYKFLVENAENNEIIIPRLSGSLPVNIVQRSEEWVDIRNILMLKHNYISATNAAIIMKVKVKKCPRKIFQEYLGKTTKQQQQNNYFMNQGIRFEKFIVQLFLTNYMGVSNRSINYYQPGILFTNPIDNLKLFCSPDFAVVDFNQLYLIEAKYWQKPNKRIPLTYEEIPLEYLIQVIVQLLVSRARYVYLVFFHDYQNISGTETNTEMTAFEIGLNNRLYYNRSVKGLGECGSVNMNTYYQEYDMPLNSLWLFQKMMDIGNEKDPEYKRLFTLYQNQPKPTHESLKKITGQRFLMYPRPSVVFNSNPNYNTLRIGN